MEERSLIYYVTNSVRVLQADIISITEEEFYQDIHHENIKDIILVDEYLGFDTETSGLDPYTNQILLVSIGSFACQYVFHTSVNYTKLFNYLKQFPLIGANLKFDHKMVKAQTGVDLGIDNKVYDVMIAEQRIFKGLEPVNPVSGRKEPFYGLDLIVKRHTYLYELKDFSHSFVGLPTSYTPQLTQIVYSAKDVAYLNLVRRSQLHYIEKYKLQYVLEEIEFPLIRVLGNAENRGLVLDVEAVKELEKQNEHSAFETALKADTEFRELRDAWLTPEERVYIVGGKYDVIRTRTPVTQFSLFDDIEDKEQVETSNKVINYKSTDEVIYMIGRLGFPAPTKKGNERNVIFNNKGKIVNSYVDDEFTTDKKLLDQYLIENPDSPLKEFLKLVITYREYKDNISKYGQSFLKKINPITNRVHTIYRQSQAENNRLQSGGGKKEPDKFQSQNIPAKLEYRKLFRGAPGSKIVTIDLTGAEAVIMADKAEDHTLFKLALEGDIHSHMATYGWRNIFRRRGDVEKGKSFLVTKTNENKEYRVKGKNATFGSIYGMGEKKAGKTLNVSPAEGRVYIDTIKSIIPKTFKMIERNVQFALTYGYIVFNTKTNSRFWFRSMKEASEQRRNLTFQEAEEIRGQAANLPISGTQADMIKEAMVVIDRKLREKNLDKEVFLVLQVHDELAYEVLNAEQALEIGEFLRDTLLTTANTYLKNIKISSSLEINDTWVK
jgi:DNA polymerase I-like protein with 3'-5' exonuclease and polymerase domains